MSPASAWHLRCSCSHSGHDLDPSADRETEVNIGPPKIDGKFGKPICVGQVAESPRALEHPICRGKPCVGGQHGRPYPGHGIAEVLDVDDLAELIRPIRLAMRAILAWPARRRLAACQHGRDRREEVAP